MKKYNYTRSTHIEGVGTIEIKLNIQHGFIRDADISGEFSSVADVKELAGMLRGAIYYKTELAKILADVDIDKYIAGLDREALLALLDE